jgi:hypothetical protein
VSPYRLVGWIVWYFRYYFQRFAYIRKATLAKLAALKWADLSIYEALVVQESVMERRVLVPRLVGGFLRIKVVDDKEQRGSCMGHAIPRGFDTRAGVILLDRNPRTLLPLVHLESWYPPGSWIH